MENTSEKKVIVNIALNEKTPEKDGNSGNNKKYTPERPKDIPQLTNFKTPEKVVTYLKNDNITGSDDKIQIGNFNVKEEIKNETEPLLQIDSEDGMISTTEQARILIAASKTPTKGVNKTPDKKMTPSGKKSIDGSPVTPGKFRRVELITLSSPKAKRFKQF